MGNFEMKDNYESNSEHPVPITANWNSSVHPVLYNISIIKENKPYIVMLNILAKWTKSSDWDSVLVYVGPTEIRNMHLYCHVNNVL